MNTTVDVVTKFNKDVIHQYEESWDDMLQRHIRSHRTRILQLQEEGVKDALNKLGYLSPHQSAELLNVLENLCWAYRMQTGLDGAWDSGLLAAQKLLEKYK